MRAVGRVESLQVVRMPSMSRKIAIMGKEGREGGREGREGWTMQGRDRELP